MLIDANASKVPAVLAKLDASPTKFYLTGSRFFGTATSSSDWDYFTELPLEYEHERQLKEFLKDNGFKMGLNHGYLDHNTLEVWSCEKVDVQIVCNAKIKMASQVTFKRKGKRSPLAKDWDNAYELVSEYLNTTMD